jgi:hypothetical protein
VYRARFPELDELLDEQDQEWMCDRRAENAVDKAMELSGEAADIKKRCPGWMCSPLVAVLKCSMSLGIQSI